MSRIIPSANLAHGLRWVLALVALATLSTFGPGQAADGRPDHPHGTLDEDCALCHDPGGWVPAVISPDFDHRRISGTPLEGAHSQANCRACHLSLDFATADASCTSCHADIHQGELGVACERCHTQRSFIDPTLFHEVHAQTHFPLRGVHRAVDCEDCHRPVAQGANQFVGTPPQCEFCHLADALTTTEPDHRGPGFSTDCQACHSEAGWSPAVFDHGFLPPGALCIQCHAEAFQATTDPDHEQQMFPQTCQDCHSTRAWIPATADHAALPAGVECVVCHRADFQDTTDPDHEQLNLQTTCEDCHTTTAWEPATFRHDSLPPTRQCVDCHLRDFQTAQNPNHLSAGFPQTCETCHVTTGWDPAIVPDHDPLYFPIYSGEHRRAWSACSDCHTVATDFSRFSCVQCHEHDDPADSADEHSGVSGYEYVSTACYTCHPRGSE